MGGMLVAHFHLEITVTVHEIYYDSRSVERESKDVK